MKKILLAILCVLTVTMAFAAGGKEQSGTTPDAAVSSAGAATTFESSRTANPQSGGIKLPIFEKPTTYNVTLSEHPSWPNTGIETGTSMVELLKRTNGTFKLQSMPGEAYIQKLGIMLNTGELPDMLVNFGVDQVLTNASLFLNIWPYVDKHMPNFKKNVIAQYPELALYKPSAGEMYTLPHTFTSDVWLESRFQHIMLYRMDILKSMNRTVPKTLTEFVDLLRAMKKAYPDIAPLVVRQNMNGMISTMSFPFDLKMAPAYLGGSLLRYDNGVWSMGVEHPNFKKYVEFLNSLYKEGLLDKEYPIVMNNTKLWEEKLTTGRGLVSLDYYGRAASLTTTARNAGNTAFEFGGQLPPVEATIAGSKSDYWTIYMTSQYMAFKKDIAQPEKFLELIDYMYYSEAGAWVMGAGVEGKTYKMTGTKSYTQIAPESEPMAWDIKNGVNRMSFTGLNPTHVGYSFDPNPYLSNPLVIAQDARFRGKAGVSIPAPLSYTNAELEIKVEVETAFKDLVEPNFVKFIIGDRPMSEWDTFLTELKKVGSQKLVDIANAAQKRMNATK